MPYNERDDETGRFNQTFGDDQFISAVRDADLPTTSEVGETVGCKYRTAYERLKRLEEDGRVESREIGNSLVWQLVNN